MISLLPRGLAWDSAANGKLGDLMRGLAAEPWRINTRADELMLDLLPSETTELLTDWEAALNLPDVYVDIADQSEDQRRDAIINRLRFRGDQSPAFFIGVLSDDGYPATITEFHPFVAGSKAGESLTNGDWVFAWQVNLLEVVTDAEKLRIEYLINKYKPAHTLALFDYA